MYRAGPVSSTDTDKECNEHQANINDTTPQEERFETFDSHDNSPLSHEFIMHKYCTINDTKKHVFNQPAALYQRFYRFYL